MRQEAHNRGNRAPYPALLRLSGGGAAVAAALFLVLGYVDKPGLPVYLKVVVAILSFIVPTLFLIGLMGLYLWCKGRVGRLGEAGLLISLIGAGLGVLHGLSTIIYVASRDSSPSTFHIILFATWLPTLFTGLTLVGIASVGQWRLRTVGALALAMGASGWIYRFTDSDALFEARLVHVFFGVLFSLGWVALGLALWTRATRQAKEPHP